CPGETEQDFHERSECVEETRVDRLGCFTYSHDERTHAHTLTDNVPQEYEESRVEHILEVQQGISHEINHQQSGHRFKVLLDRVDGDYFIGRTEYDSLEVDNEVMLDATMDYARIGDFVEVKVERAEDFDLYGKVIK